MMGTGPPNYRLDLCDVGSFELCRQLFPGSHEGIARQPTDDLGPSGGEKNLFTDVPHPSPEFHIPPVPLSSSSVFVSI
jgi:hypothetical protein